MGFPDRMEKLLNEKREQAVVEGRAEGLRFTLKLLIEHHFGPLSDAHERKIAQASADQLQTWTIRAMNVDTAEAVFG